MTGRPTDSPVPTHIAHLIRCAFGWRSTQKTLIGADGAQAVAASTAHRRAGRKLAEAVDTAERLIPRDFAGHSARLSEQAAAVKVAQVTNVATTACAHQESATAAQGAIDVMRKAVQP